mmetsp:Transcript_5761/g.12966  ORF Transcript_5761/g.12966 Transcript_5761/m.12966 type:complete len:129 (+) Transcript_5761:352-738(+)
MTVRLLMTVVPPDEGGGDERGIERARPPARPPDLADKRTEEVSVNEEEGASAANSMAFAIGPTTRAEAITPAAAMFFPLSSMSFRDRFREAKGRPFLLDTAGAVNADAPTHKAAANREDFTMVGLQIF